MASNLFPVLTDNNVRDLESTGAMDLPADDSTDAAVDLPGDDHSVEVTVTTDTSRWPHKADSEKLYLMRDSKNPDGPVLAFTPEEWEAFTLGVKDGEFDLP
jgi:uncharacterized protein DUF397